MSNSKKSSNFFETCSMGKRKAIAAKIVEQEANYVLAPRGNQSALHDDVKKLFADPELSGTASL